MHYYQESLFPIHTLHEPNGEYGGMTRAMLTRWQERVRSFQQQQRSLQPVPDPFQLPLYPMEFYRWRNNHSDPCLYFILDTSAAIVLYIGETHQANQRWQGEHDCKRYLHNYLVVHQQQQMPLSIHCSFWWQTHLTRSDRQQLEAELIHWWKSPFNKENWQVWQTPFIY